jgi:hypothetical protein
MRKILHRVNHPKDAFCLQLLWEPCDIGKYLKGGVVMELRFFPPPLVLNNVSYEIAERNMDLSTAQEYAEKAVHEEEQIWRKLQIYELNPSDLTHAEILSMSGTLLGGSTFAKTI